MRRIKIFYKFLIVMLVISALPLIIVGNRLIKINRLGLQDVILELHTREATAIADSVEEYVKNLNEKIRFVVSALYLSAAHGEGAINWTLTQGILQSLIASSGEFLTVSSVTRDGEELTKVFHPVLAGEVELMDRSEDITFIEALESGDFAVSRIYYSGDQPRMNIAYPFTSQIYLFIEASLEELAEKVRETSIGRTGFAYIVDDLGRIVMHPDIEQAVSRLDVTGRPVVSEVLSRRLVGSKEYETPEGKSVVGAYAPVAALNWGVIIQQDKEEAYFSVIEMRRNAIALLLAAIAFAAVLGYVLAQNLTRPVLKLTGAARNIAAGNFNVEVVSDWLKKAWIKDELAELAGTFIVMTDELKRYSEMQADKLNAVLLSINDGIIMTDYSGKVILSNRRVSGLLGTVQDESLAGKRISDIFGSEDMEECLKEVRESEKTIVREIDLFEGNEPKFLRTDTSVVTHSEPGAAPGTVTVIRDITLEKQLEKLKEDFVHSITHDLRSPMTSIRGFLEFLIDGTAGEISDQQREFLNIIDESSRRLLDMINNILDVAKIESGTMPVKAEDIDMASAARSAVKELEAQAKKDKVSITIDEKGSAGMIPADRNLIGRVMTNLLSNALKFTPEDGNISVTIEDAGEYVEVAVKDTGQGMPAEYVEKIFQKFEQVKGSAGKRRGTGLGLTITKYIIEAHGGTIWAESAPDQGSTFTFRIPRGGNLTSDG